MIRRRNIATVLTLVVAFAAMAATCGKLTANKLGISDPEYMVRMEKNVMVPMRDGVRLATDIYFPKGLEKAPVILVRTPYSKSVSQVTGSEDLARLTAERGYIYVAQDVRGRFKSEGDFYPFTNDGLDGQDTIAWIRSQPWYNGKIGTHGASYLGTTQWFASPGQDLDAMYLIVTSPDLKEVIYTDGGLHLMTVYFWAMLMGDRQFDASMAVKLPKVEDYLYTLPLDQADDEMGRDVEYFNQALDPAQIWDIYEKVNFDEKYETVCTPAVFVAGWYDMFLGPQLNDFVRLTEEGCGDAADSVLVVGPWGHGKSGDGSVDFGKEADQKDALGPAHALAWFDHHLKGEDSGVSAWPKVRIFVMGENKWREENEWPLARTQYTNYYIHSRGQANTRGGDGSLSPVPPGDEPPDEFIYDPANPVPSLGGNNLGLNLGPYDQSEVEDRQDVLVYSTPPLAEDLEVTGPITAVVWAITDAPDTDFTVKLLDVYPDGTPINIQDGIVRATYRDNDPKNPTPPTPGQPERYELDLWATSNLFKKGHQIRVEISSSNFPRFNRNLNNGELPPGATDIRVANQTIIHDADHPTHIALPVIPR